MVATAPAGKPTPLHVRLQRHVERVLNDPDEQRRVRAHEAVEARRLAEQEAHEARRLAEQEAHEARIAALAVVAAAPQQRHLVERRRPLPLDHEPGWRPQPQPAQVLSPSEGWCYTPLWANGTQIEILGAVDAARDLGATTRELAQELGIALNTIQQQVRELVARGWLRRDGRRLVRVYTPKEKPEETWGRLYHVARPVLAALPSGRTRTSTAVNYVRLTRMLGDSVAGEISARGFGRLYGLHESRACSMIRNLEGRGLLRRDGRRLVLLTGTSTTKTGAKARGEHRQRRAQRDETTSVVENPLPTCRSGDAKPAESPATDEVMHPPPRWRQRRRRTAA